MQKKLLLFLFLTYSVSSPLLAQYAHQNISLLSLFDDPAVTPEPTYGIRYQACWGWVDTLTGREYGIIGSTAGTYFIEVTDPANPVQRDYVAGRSQNRIWHEYKTFGNYLYIISDGGQNSLQIVDLSYLPDSVHKVYDARTIFDSGHAQYIEGNLWYVSSVTQVGNLFSSLNVYSLANPQLPVLRRRLDSDFPLIGSVHDIFVVHDTVFASCGNDGLYIFRYDSVNNRFTILGSLLSYPDQGYNHSTFISSDHTTLYMTDEVPDGMAVKVLDLSDLHNPVVVDTFSAHPGATAHNPYVKNDLLVMSYYQDGIVTYDITNPALPVQSGYFDTHPQNPAGTYPQPAYAGCWGAYTDLPSGTLLASDMQKGLFSLDVSQALGIHTPNPSATFSVYPNPVCNYLHVHLAESSGYYRFEFSNIQGKILSEISSTHEFFSDATIDVRNFPCGIYMLRIYSAGGVLSRKIGVVR